MVRVVWVIMMPFEPASDATYFMSIQIYIAVIWEATCP